MGRGGTRAADPRQLVADRDRRHHDREHAGAWTSKPGSMGRPLPGRRRVRRAAQRRRRVRRGRHARRRRRARAARRLAVDVPRLSESGRALPQVLRGDLYLTGDLVEARCRRLLLVRRPRRRRYQVGGASDRAVRGRERADGASGGGRGRRDRQARSGRRRDREGLRFAQDGVRRRATRWRWNSSGTRARGSAPPSRRRRSRSCRRSRAREAARSCGGS